MYYNQNTILYNNGEFLKASEAKTDLYGQTLHYGYGVFEGIRSYSTKTGTKIFKAHEHYNRLRKSCEYINIPFNYETNELIAVTYDLLARNNFSDAYIRPLIYCAPNMSLTRPTQVNLMICAWEWNAYLGDKLLRVCTSSYQRPNPKSTHIEAKVNGHYINSILATTEAKTKGFDEALLLDADGNVAEGPGANFFCEKNGKLFTPSKGNILPGITRATVIALCKELGIHLTETKIPHDQLKQMDSAFYCGTAAEIIGIGSIDDFTFPKDWNNSLGKQLQEAYSRLVREEQIQLTTGIN